MAYGYKNIFLVEPVTNLIMTWLTAMNLARRDEYPGVSPGRIEIPKLRNLCSHYGYSLSYKTIWHIPEDYLYKLPIIFRSMIPALCDALSVLTRNFSLGNFIVCHIAKVT